MHGLAIREHTFNATKLGGTVHSTVKRPSPRLAVFCPSNEDGRPRTSSLMSFHWISNGVGAVASFKDTKSKVPHDEHVVFPCGRSPRVTHPWCRTSAPAMTFEHP